MHFSDLSPAWLATPFTVSFTSSSHLLERIVPPSPPLILSSCPPVTLTSILRTTLSIQPSQQPHVDVKLASGTYMTLYKYLHLSPDPSPSSHPHRWGYHAVRWSHPGISFFPRISTTSKTFQWYPKVCPCLLSPIPSTPVPHTTSGLNGCSVISGSSTWLPVLL